MGTPRPASNKSDAAGNRGRGRPREFDVDEAIDKAVTIFGERGFHATSTTDLAQAMGVTVGSLYKAFEDKRAVFLAALDRQMERRNQELGAVLAAVPTGRLKVYGLLMNYALWSYGTKGRCGCLVVGTAIELATFDPEICARVLTSLKQRETLLMELIRLGQADRSISSALDVPATARCLLCLLQGLRVVGKTSPTRTEMTAAVNVAKKLLD